MEDKIIAVTGYEGRLGSEFIKLGCVPLECNLFFGKQIKEAIEAVNPDVIIHCGAVTDVDGCEDYFFQDAMKVNIRGTQFVRNFFDGQVIHMSTDYIFDGRNGPYSEEDKPCPISHYGWTKNASEEVIREFNFPRDIIVRTTILYGGNKPDFVTKILDQLKEGKEVTVTTSLIGNPTYVPHLAEAIMKLIEFQKPPRIVNISGTDCISRYKFATMIAETFGYPEEQLVATGKHMNEMAKRPPKAGLKLHLARALGLPLYSAEEGLKAYKEKLDAG